MKKWYVVNTYSGHENKVRTTLERRIESMGLNRHFGEISIPTENVIEIKDGKKVPTVQRQFPGYVLVKMDLDDETWHLVRDTPKVTGFLGARNKPQPIPEAEAMRMVQQLTESAEKPKRPAVLFEIGEQVRVADGPFASFNGLVEEVDEERARLKVAVSIFGRATPVELEYAQVEKL